MTDILSLLASTYTSSKQPELLFRSKSREKLTKDLLKSSPSIFD